MKDLYHNLNVQQVLSPVVSTTSKTSSAIDMQGFESAIVSVAIGQSGDSLSGSVYWTLKLQHSDTDSGYADVTADELMNDSATVVVNSSSLDETAYNFGYKGGKRYVKAVATPSGSHSSGTPIAMLAVQGHASYSPVV
jgi:hypothetical protein